MNRPILPCLAILTFCAVSGCRKPPSTDSNSPATDKPRVPVQTAVAVEKPMPRFLQLTGELTSASDSNVAADTTGKVAATPVERGTEVKAGEILIRLDDRSTTLNLAEAEANLLLAKSKLTLADTEVARNEPLARSKAIPDTEFARLKADRDGQAASAAAAESRRDTALKSQNDTIVRAPFNGTVAERMVSAGEYVKPDTTVVRLVDLTNLRLLMNVAEPDIGRIKTGQTVGFTVAAWPDTTFQATVQFIGPAVRSDSRDLQIEAEAPNPDNRLRPGFFASARLILPDKPSVTVPSSAVRTDGAVNRLWVVKEGHLEERLVETGNSKDGVLEIRRGVTAGESVVLEPGAAAADGLSVTIQP